MKLLPLLPVEQTLLMNIVQKEYIYERINWMVGKGEKPQYMEMLDDLEKALTSDVSPNVEFVTIKGKYTKALKFPNSYIAILLFLVGELINEFEEDEEMPKFLTVLYAKLEYHLQDC